MTDNNSQLQKEAFEAINGAFYRLEYEFLGETEEGVTAWWHKGRYPRDMRIRVQRSALVDFVELTTTYRGVLGVGSLLQNVDCRGTKSRVVAATETAVKRNLEIYRDVLDQTGVAGPGAELPTIESTADSNVPETEQEADDAGL